MERLNDPYKVDIEMQSPNKYIRCGICGENHSPNVCGVISVTNHIPDKIIPTKARLTLPDYLEIRTFSDCTYNVYAQCLIERGTRFGPFQAKKLFSLIPSIEFPLKIFTSNDDDLSEYYLDTTDENECSWMMFVGPANDLDEQNLICYQEGEHLYYVAIRNINSKEPLKVWYSPYYATKMKKAVLCSTPREDHNKTTSTVDIDSILKKKKNIMPRDLWSCKFCGKVEKELSVFAIHLLDHYNTQSRKICEICKESFISRQNWKKHLRFAHCSSLKKKSEPAVEHQVAVSKIGDNNESKDSTPGGPLLLNDIAPDSLDNSGLLLPHTVLNQFDISGIENHSGLLENENLNLNTDNILIENIKELEHFNFEIKESETEQLVCDICLKNFIKLRSLILHIEQHTGKYLCNVCNKVFARKENLDFHSCNSYYKIKCSLCDRVFFQKKYLTQHMKSTHNKEFSCHQCHKFYDSKNSLDTHNCPSLPVHKKEKFPCPICSKIFFRNKYLRQHLRRHDNPRQSQEFICAVCNMTLNSRKTYLKHCKLHENPVYRCEICDKIFRRDDILKDHKKKVHFELERVETCDICNKTVKSKKLLKTHMAVHQSEKMHVCPLCQATFNNRSNLTRHVKIHKSSQSDLYDDGTKFFCCPKCGKKMKLKSSLSRHLKMFHTDHKLENEGKVPKGGKGDERKEKKNDNNFIKSTIPEIDSSVGNDESIMDLKQTIENMNFNTDEVNNCSENNDINIEIDKILNNANNIEHFLSESSDQIVESLLDIATKENHCQPKEVCLSMPDLTENDQDIELGENAYILENGTIVEPQKNSSKFVVYVLNQEKFPY